MERPWIAANDEERARLNGLVERLGDDDLAHPMPAGWTVAGVLAHLAFWDARATYLVDKWAAGRPFTPSDEEPADVDWINDAAKPLCLAMPPRTAARVALEQAALADARVAALPAEVAARIAAEGPFNPARADHRREHLDEIERALRA